MSTTSSPAAVPYVDTPGQAGQLLLLASGVALMAVGLLVAAPVTQSGLRVLAAAGSVAPWSDLSLVALAVTQALLTGGACVLLGARLVTGDRAGHRGGLPLAAVPGLNALLVRAPAAHTTWIALLAGVTLSAGCLPPALRAAVPERCRAQPGEVVAAVALSGLLAGSALVTVAISIVLATTSVETVALLVGGLAVLALLPGVYWGRPLPRTLLTGLAVASALRTGWLAGTGAHATGATPALLPLAVVALLWLPELSARWFVSGDRLRRWVLR